MKRRRRASRKSTGEKRQRMSSNVEIIAQRAWQRLQLTPVGDGRVSRPYWAPVNLVTGNPYGGLNHAILDRVLPAGALSLFCTLKQANGVGAHVRQGEQAIARIVFYKSDEQDRRLPVWTPIFHISQLEGIPDACLQVHAMQRLSLVLFRVVVRLFVYPYSPPCLQDYDLRSRLTLLPVWMTKLNALYKRREALPADHAIALPAARVPPLVLLAARAFLLSQTSPAKIDALLTPDLRALLWPVGGLDAADTVLNRVWSRDPAITPSLPPHLERAPFDAQHPRAVYATPAAYYLSVFYTLARLMLDPHVAPGKTLVAASSLGMLTFCEAAHLSTADERAPEHARAVKEKELQTALGGCLIRIAADRGHGE